MRLFLTGAAGRLARPLVAQLARQHEITAFDRQDSPDRLPEGVCYVQGDLRDADKLRRSAAGAEVVIHLGAIPGRVDHMPQSELFEINVQGTFHVFEAAARAGARMVILASSICAIGLPDALDRHGLAYLPIDEEHPCRPRHTYDLTKRLNEIMAETFTRLAGIPTICFRFPMLCDVRRDTWFVKHLYHDPPYLTLADYLDYQDAIAAIEFAMQRNDLTHEVLQLNAGTIGTVKSTKEHLASLMPPVPWRGDPPADTTPLLNCAKAGRVLNWSPKITWQQGTATSEH